MIKNNSFNKTSIGKEVISGDVVRLTGVFQYQVHGIIVTFAALFSKMDKL